MIDFKPINLDVKDKCRNLDVCAKGVVKGTKYFPVFLIDGEEYIFKPISRTKPYATTLFSYAESYWSYVINRFFDDKTPVCRLAYCHGLNGEQAKYYDKGILVKSIIKGNQKLLNILEYFEMYPEAKVNIKDYINYCMEFYSYKDILDSDFIKNNPSLGADLAFQILLSILRQDYNYHYENINFIVENGSIVSVAPPIDFEFSCMFMFPEDDFKQKIYYEDYLSQLKIVNGAQIAIAKFFNNLGMLRSKCLENISKIVLEYPDVVKRFLKCLEEFYKHVDDIDISDDYDFIEKVDSNAWEIGYYTFKENNPDKLQEAYKKVNYQELDKAKVFARIKEQIKGNIEELGKILNIYIYAVNSGFTDLEHLTFEDLVELKAKDNNELALSIKRTLEKGN